MARLACRCLNISVFVTTHGWQTNSLPTARLFGELSRVKEGVVYEVNLDVGGIVVELNVLACATHVGDWIINSCSNCETDVYITHAIKGDRTFVFPGVLSGDAIQGVCQHRNYSSIFKILLKPMQEDGDMLRRKRVSSMSFGREDPDMKLVHQQMKSYLKIKEEEMEERIRTYEEQQRKDFLTLQKNAHHERSLLFSAIAKIQESRLKSEEVKPLAIDSKKELGPSEPMPKEKNKRTHDAVKPDSQQVTITIQDKSSYSLSKLPNEDEEDSLFALDEEHAVYEGHQSHVADMGEMAFPQSDDDDNSTNDSSFRDVSALSGINLATSVPVSIPLFKRSTDTSTTSSSNNDECGDVGDSIRQLALSVQDTGMFGDLPRPRMMTNPFS